MFKSLFIKIYFIICMTGLIGQPSLALSTQDSPGKDYILGPGDVIEIRVWENDDLNRTVEISYEGSFSFPFIGKIRAAGLNVFGLENELKKKLADGYLVAPQVTVKIVDYVHKKIFLHGEVKKPGSYVIKGKTHLLAVISDAAGFTDEVGETITIVTPGSEERKNAPSLPNTSGGNRIFTVEIDMLISGAANQDIFVAPGDSIYVSKAEGVFVTGEVKKPGKVKWESHMSVRQAISLAGGPTNKGSPSRTRILRMKNGVEKEISPHMSDPVLPGDIIKVPESYF